MRHAIARFFVTVCALFAVTFGSVALTATSAFAETTDTNTSVNMYMSYGLQYDTATKTVHLTSTSNVFQPTATTPYNWYSCYIPDCDGLVSDHAGVHLLSSEKGQQAIATDHHILFGNFTYSYIDPMGAILSYSNRWNGTGTLAWNKQFYSADAHQWYTLRLTYVSLEIHWDGQPVLPVCDPKIDTCSLK